jgi:nitrous oxide reductase
VVDALAARPHYRPRRPRHPARDRLVGAHNLHGLAGVTAVGGTWTVCNGTIHVASAEEDTTT